MQRAATMSVPTDFFTLYRELGIDPACTPEDFKRAYRRRVAELHPDRSGDRQAGEEALKNLNLGYAAALEFLRTHGRLPGAPIAASAHAPAPASASAATRSPPGDEAGAEDDAGAAPKRRRRLRLALAVLAIVFAVSQFPDLSPGGDSADAMDAVPTPPAASAARARPAPELRLEVGMPSADVLASLGAPTDTAQGGRQWHYGPSWILTACGRVHDWYSSPLKPLGASRREPDPDERQDPPAHCADPLPGLHATR